MIQPKKFGEGIKPQAEYIITVNWLSVDMRYDVDTWMRLPDGSVVGYRNKESNLVFLERDDLGGDCIETSGKVVSPCEEAIVMRGKKPGEYLLSVHLFSVNSTEVDGAAVPPIRASVRITKINPNISIVWQKELVFDTNRQEIRLIRFLMTPDGVLDAFNTDDLPSIIYADQHPSTPGNYQP